MVLLFYSLINRAIIKAYHLFLFLYPLAKAEEDILSLLILTLSRYAHIYLKLRSFGASKIINSHFLRLIFGLCKGAFFVLLQPKTNHFLGGIIL